MRTRIDAVRRSWSEAFGDDGSIDRVTRRRILLVALAVCACLFAMAWRRHATFHERTFDLAFYARMAWGVAHFDGWEPMVNAHVAGLHIVWPFLVLGPIGRLVGEVPTLLLAQSLAVGLTAWPLARIGARVLGAADPGHASTRILGAWAGAMLWLLHPNIWHVASADFHPGTLACLPLAWCCDALHRKSAAGLGWSGLAVLACREDLGLIVAVFGLAFAWRSRASRAERRIGLVISFAALAYVAMFLGVIHPHFAPPVGSFELHYGRWGSSPFEALVHVAAQPLESVRWLASSERSAYWLIVTAPVAFACFLAPEWLVLAAPILGMNLLSSFPTTLFLDSHYLTPAVPILVAAALVGLRRMPSIVGGVPIAFATGLALLVAAIAHVVASGSPLGMRFDANAFRDDERSRAARAIVARIPLDASVQAPDWMLSHLAERRVVRRGPPPETGTSYVVLDGWVRRLEHHREELLRTTEEPLLRDWLARHDHTLLAVEHDLYLLARGDFGDDVHVGRRFVRGRTDPSAGRALTGCLGLLGARREATADEVTLVLDLVARGPCPSDLALRIGWGYRPRRVDLVAQGWLSPAHFRAGDLIESRHPMSPNELEAIAAHGLRVGAIRQSGARPEPTDPVALDVAFDASTVDVAP